MFISVVNSFNFQCTLLTKTIRITNILGILWCRGFFCCVSRGFTRIVLLRSLWSSWSVELSFPGDLTDLRGFEIEYGVQLPFGLFICQRDYTELYCFARSLWSSWFVEVCFRSISRICSDCLSLGDMETRNGEIREICEIRVQKNLMITEIYVFFSLEHELLELHECW